MAESSAVQANVGRAGRRRRELASVALLGLGALALVAVGPRILDTYTVNILIRSLLYAATALTVDILWGYTGILTFGQSAFFGIGAYAAALVFTHIGFSPGEAILALLAGMAVSAVVAAAVGWLAFGYGAPPLYVAVVTLVVPIILVQLLYSGGTFTGSSSGLVGFDTFDLSVEQWFWIAGAGLVILTCAAWVFVRSDFGRLLVAIRENEERCQYLGINTARVKILLMAAMAAIAAVAGYAYAGYTVVVAPEIAGFVFGTELLIWVALGGRGTLLGPVLGTVLIDLTSAYLSGNLPYVWKLIVGVIFVAVIVALPQGLMPVLRFPFRRLLRVGAEAAAPPLRKAATSMLPGAEAGEARALQTEGLSRHYGSLKVLEAIHLEVRPGELVSIVGPNGAGKTTLMRCISDGHERTAGTVRVNGHDIGHLAPHTIVGFGIGRSFQLTNLFETLTVAECLRLARYRHESLSATSSSEFIDLPDAALQVVRATGLETVLGVEARHLSHGMKRALELAMVLALEPTLLLLDEPTAGLTKTERSLIGAILVDLVRSHALSIVIIEHDLDFVREISFRVIVLHQGRILLDGTVEEVVRSELVQAIYAGQGISA